MVKSKLVAWLHQTSPPMATSSNEERRRQTVRHTVDLPASLPEIKRHKQKLQREELPSSNNNSRIANSQRKNNTPTTMASSKMIALAQKITSETEKVEAYFKVNGLVTPSFDAHAPGDFPFMPDDISRSRREVIQATEELHDLMVGPRESIRWMAWDFMNTQSLQLLNHFGIPALVPLDGSITLSELQAKTSLDPINLARVLRHAMTNHVFQELKPGVIAHTAASRLLAEDQELQSWVIFNTEGVYPASAQVINALKAYPEATNLTRTGFNFAFNTVNLEPMFVTIGKDPKRAGRMAQAMSSLTGGEGYELWYLSEGCDLTDVNARGGTMVDVGGSHGFVDVHLAKVYNNIKFVVQDLPSTVESAPKPICADAKISKRIQFQAHDFFKEQPIRGADVYFFRWIMHNYSTPYAVQILRNLIPALKPGARIIINDHCLREPGTENPWDERLIRSMDLVMLSLLNAQERGEEDFKQLFKIAGDGFVFKGVTRPKGCRMSIIEAVWKPDEVDQTMVTENLSELTLT
ncbi:S-adenosyl-L-methionine-dependent methyltransferase [Daldinia bambusicola]|nr:S-adenosyl-L-methionine-dependent methyltransferase [Daldinia bambusicola]